jgi:streptomycin 6-kinase
MDSEGAKALLQRLEEQRGDWPVEAPPPTGVASLNRWYETLAAREAADAAAKLEATRVETQAVA